MRHRLIALEARHEWEQALEGVPHTFAHTWGHCQSMALATGYPTYLYSLDAHGERVVCAIAERSFEGHTDVVSPYGFAGFSATGDVPRFPEQWRDFAVSRNWVCGYFALHPITERTSLFDAADSTRRGDLYIWDLSMEVPRLRAGLSENRRRQIRDWEAMGSPAVTAVEDLCEFVLREQAGFFAHRDASATYRFDAPVWETLLALPDVVAVGAANAHGIVAASIFGYTAWAGEFLFNVSCPEGRSYSTALLWEGALRLKALGVPCLNLGGGVHPGDGVARFKERFGARRLPSTRLCQVYDPHTYARLCDRPGVARHEPSRYFPPYRQP